MIDSIYHSFFAFANIHNELYHFSLAKLENMFLIILPLQPEHRRIASWYQKDSHRVSHRVPDEPDSV